MSDTDWLQNTRGFSESTMVSRRIPDDVRLFESVDVQLMMFKPNWNVMFDAREVGLPLSKYVVLLVGRVIMQEELRSTAGVPPTGSEPLLTEDCMPRG